MICDICGGTLVMQPGAIAKCDCCGIDYSTESLRAKFASAQTANNIQTDSVSTYSYNNTDYGVTTVDREYSGATAVESTNLYEQFVETDIIPKKIANKDLSETERKLAQFFHDSAFAERMLEIRKIWKELGLHEVAELQELNKMIDDKAEFERFYGFQNKDIAALLKEWESEYRIEMPEEIDENEEFVEEALAETKREYIDLLCPGCFEKLSFFNWQLTVGEQFICPYCGENFVFKENQILY